jgi:hypothetical protein
MAQKMMIAKIPSSMIEKAQISIPPNVIGVKTRRKIKITFMR